MITKEAHGMHNAVSYAYMALPTWHPGLRFRDQASLMRILRPDR